MRLLHTADLHIGAPFTMLGEERGREQREQLLATFERVCELGVKRKVEVVLVAGDLFDRAQVGPATLARVSRIFERLASARIPAVLIPGTGTHDAAVAGGVWERWTPPDGAHLLTADRPSLRLEDLDLTVHGVVGSGARLRAGVAALAPDAASRYNVAMIHGSLPMPGLTDDSGEDPIDPEAVAASGMDYVALGHWHGVAEHRFGSVVAAYPGSPEPLDFDQRRAGSVLVVEIDEAGARVEVVEVGRRRLEKLDIDIGQIASEEALASEIERRAGPDLGLDVRLSGVRPPGLTLDIDDMTSTLEARFFRLKITDATHPSLTAVDPACYPEATVIGRFVRMLEGQGSATDQPTRDEIAEALALGVALLEGRKVPL